MRRSKLPHETERFIEYTHVERTDLESTQNERVHFLNAHEAEIAQLCGATFLEKGVFEFTAVLECRKPSEDWDEGTRFVKWAARFEQEEYDESSGLVTPFVLQDHVLRGVANDIGCPLLQDILQQAMENLKHKLKAVE